MSPSPDRSQQIHDREARRPSAQTWTTNNNSGIVNNSGNDIYAELGSRES